MATPAIRTFLEDLLHREAMPTLDDIPGHPRERYIDSVLERFANPGVHDQIARVCIDGSAKFERARRVAALVDQSKFGNVQMFSFATFDEIDVLVTDTRVDPEAVDFLTSHDIAVHCA